MFVACDESGIDPSKKYLVIGSAWISKENLVELEKRVTEIRLKEKCWGEIEWKKVKNSTSNAMFKVYKDFIDLAFQDLSIFFHFVVVEKSLLDMVKYHNDSLELVRFKFMQMLLSRHAENFLDPKGRRGLHIVFDSFDMNERARGEAAKIRSFIERRLDGPIEHLQPCASHICSLIQICDLLTGAIASSWNEPPSKISSKKEKLIKIIEEKSGKVLKSRTLVTERKFNIWVWQPTRRVS